MKFIGVALSGGNSSRMGQDKAQLLRLNQTMLSYTEQILNAAGAHEVLVSSKLGATYGVPDKYLNLGPLAGIDAVLSRQTSSTWCLFCPIDLPLLDKKVLIELVRHTAQTKVTTHYQNHPLPLLIQANSTNLAILEVILKQAENLSIRHFLNQIETVTLPTTSEQNWFNANTPTQWQQALEKII